MPNSPDTIASIGGTSVTITLYHLVWMIKRMPNTCGQLFLLNTYLTSPSRIEELYVLGVINTSCTNCEAACRYSFNQSTSTWEYF